MPFTRCMMYNNYPKVNLIKSNRCQTVFVRPTELTNPNIYILINCDWTNSRINNSIYKTLNT